MKIDKMEHLHTVVYVVYYCLQLSKPSQEQKVLQYSTCPLVMVTGLEQRPPLPVLAGSYRGEATCGT